MTTDTAAPIRTSERITNLDTIRGIATLGILLMNVVSFGLADPAYFNLDADGSDTWLDWLIGGFGEIFADQKMMGLFSLLFGAGIIVFADRAQAKGRRPVALSLWRNLLLFGIGFAHSLLWSGDILMVYAGCSVLLLMARNRSPRTLIALGVAIFAIAALAGVIAGSSVSASGPELGEIWAVDAESSMSAAVEVWFILDFGGRALAMMLIGVAFFRLGIIQGTRDPEADRSMARWGLGIGLPLAAASVALIAINDFSPEWALGSHALNTVATIPVVLGYTAVISLWNRRPDTWLHERLRAVGRMALTNYLTQTILGVLVLEQLLGDRGLTRTSLIGFVLAVWAAQLAWSTPWLTYFKFGPFEWLWRMATYRRWQPIRSAPRSDA